MSVECSFSFFFFFFFNDTATTEIYTVRNTLSLHDALPTWPPRRPRTWPCSPPARAAGPRSEEHTSELQSLRTISYAVFCLKKKKKKIPYTPFLQSIINQKIKKYKTQY